MIIICHLIFDIKQDGHHKAIFVAGVYLTGDQGDTYYSSVDTLRSMRILVFLLELKTWNYMQEILEIPIWRMTQMKSMFLWR